MMKASAARDARVYRHAFRQGLDTHQIAILANTGLPEGGRKITEANVANALHHLKEFEIAVLAELAERRRINSERKADHSAAGARQLRGDAAFYSDPAQSSSLCG